MSQVNLNSAFDPLAPLKCWVTYTQAEVVRLKADLRTTKWKKIIRFASYSNDRSTSYNLNNQRLTEVIEAVAELFDQQKRAQDLIAVAGRLECPERTNSTAGSAFDSTGHTASRLRERLHTRPNRQKQVNHDLNE